MFMHLVAFFMLSSYAPFSVSIILFFNDACLRKICTSIKLTDKEESECIISSGIDVASLPPDD